MIPVVPALFFTAFAQDPAPQPPPAEAEWIRLFDGKTLNGWRRVNGSARYEVRDGAIVGTTAKGSPNSFLCTERYFGDFELRFEVKLFDDRLNSGVQIRSLSIPSYRNGRVHGPQVEISTNGNAGFVYDEARRGWLSKDRDDPAKRAAFRRGEWNRYRVLCEGPRIRTWVNGVPVADVVDPLATNGFVGLQVHSVRGDPRWQVAWRELRLRILGDGGGWSPLFDGKSLSGWRVAEHPDSVRVEKGAIVLGGPRAHAYYLGPIHNHDFRNFELEAEVWTEPHANSGIYFHTAYQEKGWPAKGYEVQVNNTHPDPRKTGGLYGIADVGRSPVRDRKWFTVHVAVRGKEIVVKLDGEEVVRYVEPEDVKRPRRFAGRKLDRGTFALQCHDPRSTVRYRAVRVRVLPEWPD